MRRATIRLPEILILAALLAGCAPTARTADQVTGGSAAATTAPDNAAPAPAAEHPLSSAEKHAWQDLASPDIVAAEGPVVMRAEGFPVSRMDYESALSQFLAGRDRTPDLEKEFRGNLSDQLAVMRWFEESGWLDNPANRVAARQAIRESLSALIIDGTAPPPPTDEQLRTVYTSRLDSYTIPERVQVRIIQVPTQEEGRAILDRLAKGESFRSLAASESVHASRSEFGEIDPFARGTYIQGFEDVAFALPPGETGSVETPAGFFIIQKVANLPASRRPFDDVKDELRAEVEGENHAAHQKEMIDQIRRELK